MKALTPSPATATATATSSASARRSTTFNFEVRDVTNTMVFEAENMQRSAPAAAVASALAKRMGLPGNVPWNLRSDATGAVLEDRPIGDQIEAGDRVVLSPKAHLG